MHTYAAAMSAKDPRVGRAVQLWQKSPALTVEQVMLAAEFSPVDAKSRKCQAWIRRRAPLKKNAKKPALIEVQSPDTAVSSLTESPPEARKESRKRKHDAEHPMPKPERKRRTVKVLQQDHINAKAKEEHQKKAHKRATSLYAVEQEKEDGMSAQDVREAVLKDYEWAPSVRSIQRYVEKGMAGQSPMKRGEKGDVPKVIFNTLCTAFETMVRINQLNGRDIDNSQKRLGARVNTCMNKDGSVSVSLVRRLFAETAVDLYCSSKNNAAEERRIAWTTYSNLKTWFENWEKDLLKLGFAKCKTCGEVYIPKDQLKNIVNVDETCLSFDGSNGTRGGRPEAVFFDPNLPRLGKATAKTGKTTMMITGSTAEGEPIPPHFQFQTAAQSGDTMRLNNMMLKYMPTITGKFCCDEEQDWDPTFGMNGKGGMDDEEFEKYVIKNLVRLWLNARDVPGRRVMLKADSDPGRTKKALLARLRLLGFILYLGVPNTTGISQETDRNYGPFKTQFRINLDGRRRFTDGGGGRRFSDGGGPGGGGASHPRIQHIHKIYVEANLS